MSDYKFKVGDKVKILKMDEWSNKGMVGDIGRIGVIVDCSNYEGVNGYLINDFWYMENSLEFIESKEGLISKDDVLNIFYETKESGIFNHKTIYDLIRRVSELPCK